MSRIHKHQITFQGQPTILELTRALDEAEQLFGAYAEVSIETLGGAENAVHEIYFSMEMAI